MGKRSQRAPRGEGRVGDAPPKLLWHSNAPWVPTGYGAQTRLFLPHLAAPYDLAISAFYGLEGAPIEWEGVPVFPGLGGDYGSETLPAHAYQFFDRNARGGLVLTLMDVWVLDAAKMRNLDVIAWCPVDHAPAPPAVIDFFVESHAVPVAMSRFGQEQLAQLDALYVPHAVDCQIFKPMDQDVAREQSFPPGAFIVGMVAANKGRPSRKGFSQALIAFERFAQRHDNAFLYLHTTLDPTYSQGENLPALIRALGIPMDRVRIADQYTMAYNPYTQKQMARIFAVMDVLLNPSWGEGFGIPVLEAAACGVPAIVTDFSAMPEVLGAGWAVQHEPYWTAQNSWQAIPLVDDIESALEECYAATPAVRAKLQTEARRHALRFDVPRVTKQHMLPALREAARRFELRRPISVPSRVERITA